MSGTFDYSGTVRASTGPASLTFSRAGGLRAFANLSWGLIFLIVAIGLVGTAMLYSVSQSGVVAADLWAQHLLRFGLGLVAMIALALVPLQVWFRLAVPGYLATLALLVAVELFGTVRGGAQRWLEIGPIAVQPSEPMKLALTLVLARYYHGLLAQRSQNFLMHLGALGLILLPASLIFKQPDFGTTLALIASGGVIVFLAGLNRWIILSGLLAGAVASIPVYHLVLEDYQRERVDTFLEQLAGENTDALGDGYQIEQAKIAIGSGGLWGKGYMEGTQTKLEYIPEQHTDFILTVVAEELGFFGASGLLLLWATVLVWGTVVAWRCSSLFGSFAAAGAVGTVAFYLMFNVGMVLGLLPVVGVPMPLVSYGGTAMLTTLLAFGVILSVDLHNDERMPS